MSRIITGHFQHPEQLQEAVALLSAEGFGSEDYAIYYFNPPGSHGLYRIGGDASADEGTAGSGKSAAAGAAVGGTAGAAIGMLGGPIGALVVGGAGAYVGSLWGALSTMEDPDRAKATTEHPAEPPSGPMLAINIDRAEAGTEHDAEPTAVAILTRCAAMQVDRANGTWKDGEWVDFDPRVPVETLHRREPSIS